MAHIMLICKSGVMYSGELIKEYNKNLKWIGIKPSKKSEVCLFFDSDRVKKIYFEDGNTYTKIESNLKEKPAFDLEVPENSNVLIRVKGGVTYIGEKLIELHEEITPKQGLWISPSNIKETIIYIPESEIEVMKSL